MAKVENEQSVRGAEAGGHDIRYPAGLPAVFKAAAVADIRARGVRDRTVQTLGAQSAKALHRPFRGPVDAVHAGIGAEEDKIQMVRKTVGLAQFTPEV